MKKSDAVKAAKQYGCGLDADYMQDWQILLWSPKGKVFASSGCHVDASLSGVNDKVFDWSGIVSEVHNICSELDECQEENCEVCNDL